ncbi:UPF0496 protein 1-like [Salvia hispanica]|uniref:UPF0496 protein 1-like n=1 Tax=Salvia hispanica TaxID=49212 RepID=UPI0020094D5A|nr:UPF0496 protein 1-like [Salvia hispanica]
MSTADASSLTTSPLQNEQLVSAILDVHKDATNTEKLLEFARSHYVSRLETPEFSLAPSILHNFFHDLSHLYTEHVMTGEMLRSLDKAFAQKLHRIAAYKKVSAVFFTAAAVICVWAAAANADSNRPAAAAAAAASVLFGALGTWIQSLLKKRERAVESRKETLGVMIIGAKIAVKDLSSVHVVARRLQFEAESLSETVDDHGEKVAALEKCFEELLGKVDDYRGDMKWVKRVVIQSSIS